jgi:phosphatidylserine decarboxylase
MLRRRALIELLRVLPRAGISRLMGRVAGLHLPPVLQRWEIELFARAAGVDLSEVTQPLASFTSLQEFFTRPLSPGARTIDVTPKAFVAPCDGAWGEAGPIDHGRLCQIKGRTYTVASLLGSADRAAGFDGGVFATFYLAPHNYHRVHTPCALRIDAAEHIAGTLWPVNRAGLEGVENLFARNERIAAYAAVVGGEPGARLCMVAVGAVMVGKVRVVFDELTTNTGGAAGPRRLHTYEPGVEFGPGIEWGRFEFGSTVVLLASPGTLRLEPAAPGVAVSLGERIGRLSP